MKHTQSCLKKPLYRLDEVEEELGSDWLDLRDLAVSGEILVALAAEHLGVDIKQKIYYHGDEMEASDESALFSDQEITGPVYIADMNFPHEKDGCVNVGPGNAVVLADVWDRRGIGPPVDFMDAKQGVLHDEVAVCYSSLRVTAKELHRLAEHLGRPLTGGAEERGAPEDDTLGTRSKNTYLRVIAALAEHCGAHGVSRSADLDIVKAILDESGFNSPGTKRLRQVLGEAQLFFDAAEAHKRRKEEEHRKRLQQPPRAQG